MLEAPPPDLDRVYVLTESGLQQLVGGSTSLPDNALRLLVLIDGKLPLARLAKHLEGVSAGAELNAIASRLILSGYIKPLSSDAMKLADDLGAMDFFADSQEETGSEAERREIAFARALEEAQNTAMKLKQQGFCARIARRPERRPRHGEGAYSVLVVEDNPSLAGVTRKFLSLEGFEPRMASNREELVAELRKTPLPDVVLLDILLPDADGFEVLATLRRHPALKALPVILLTAKSTKEDVMHGLILGADGYVTKPFEFEILVAAMKAVLGLDEPEPEQGPES